MGQHWEISLFCHFQLLGSYWEVHWLKLAPGLKKVTWGKTTPHNILLKFFLPNFEKILKLETLISGCVPCSQSVRGQPRWPAAAGQDWLSDGLIPNNPLLHPTSKELSPAFSERYLNDWTNATPFLYKTVKCTWHRFSLSDKESVDF